MRHESVPARPFGALLTALVTPMRLDGSVDIDAAVTLAGHLLAQGHDGLVINGTTGESPTTSATEKRDLVRAIVQAHGDKAHIVAGVGTNSTASSQVLAEAAADAGASGLLVVSPYYNRPSQRGLVAHFSAVAGVSDLPVMLYDIPGRCGVAIGDEALAELAANPAIVAMKDATGNVGQAATRVRTSNLAWYCGDDALILPFLALGGAGLVSVTAHVASAAFADMIRGFDRGNVEAARTRFAEVAPLIDAIMGGGQGAVMVKAALAKLGLIPTPTVRLPLVEATPNELTNLDHAIGAANNR